MVTCQQQEQAVSAVQQATQHLEQMWQWPMDPKKKQSAQAYSQKHSSRRKYHMLLRFWQGRLPQHTTEKRSTAQHGTAQNNAAKYSWKGQQPAKRKHC
jgi:hypothetical protein